ncbi:hypothetical protein LXL04_019267 [Taraxacum kok-saghyz]
MKPVERNPMEINSRLAPLQSNAVQNDVQYIKEDISLVERHRINLYRARDRHYFISFWKTTRKYTNERGFKWIDLAVTLKKRVQSQFNDLQHCYLQKRRQVTNPLQNHDKRDDDVIQREGIVQVYQIFNLYFPLLHNIGNLSIYISIIISIFL